MLSHEQGTLFSLCCTSRGNEQLTFFFFISLCLQISVAFILNIFFSRPKNSGLFGHFFHIIGLLFSLLKHKFLNLFQFYCVILKLMIRSALKTWTTHIHSQWNYKVFLLIHYKFLNNSNIPFSHLFQMTKLIIKNVFATRSYAVASHSHSFNMEGQKGFLGDNLGDFFCHVHFASNEEWILYFCLNTVLYM